MIVLCVVILSCKTSNEKLSEKIKVLEKELVSPGKPIDKAKSAELVRNYEAFAAQYPSDTLTPRYLQKAGEIMMNTGNAMRAIEFFDRVCNDYTQYRNAPECLFMKGFVYETLLNNLDMARQTYQKFLKLYPRNDFADDAQAMLNNLGKSPEALIREFEAKNTGAK